jgi:uncharacterized membrane protein
MGTVTAGVPYPMDTLWLSIVVILIVGTVRGRAVLDIIAGPTLALLVVLVVEIFVPFNQTTKEEIIRMISRIRSYESV